MRGMFLDIEDRQSVRCKNALDRCQRQIRKVLVINRVKLIFSHQLHEVGELESGDAVWF